ncbi:MAG: hypothetical protein EPO35_08865 [Acidobacteria bacterium]|nr:MAG: hypothetical protein EPO35_08865 [Acidobacteriota bacterium]
MRMPTSIRAALVIAVVAASASLAAQTPATNPRFGQWKLKSENPPPSSNIMTYEAYNGTGMKVTIDAVNAQGVKTSWGYITMFDGKDQDVTGRQGQTSAVTTINEKINIIVNKTNGKVTQLLINTLSADNNTINVSYLSTNAAGETRTTTAVYERIVK